MNRKWYENTLFIFIMLIAFFPLGFYLIYRNKELRKELMPVAIVVGIAMVGIVGYTLITGDWQKPELEVKAEMTYAVDTEFSPELLITDYVEKVSDNKTDLTKEDVQIKNYAKLDFSKTGEQEISFLVSDDDHNNAVATATLNIK